MKILHVGVGNLGRGGVSTYLGSVSHGQRERGHEVGITELWPIDESASMAPEILRTIPELLAKIERFRPDAVHLHSLLPDYAGLGTNTVITAHDHSPHCPSGGRYLEVPGKACTRNFSTLGCLAGHFFQKCGSRSPRSLKSKFRITASASSFPGQWIAPSRYASEWMGRRGIDASRIHLVANPGPFTLCEPSSRELPSPARFLFIGRLVPNKGASVAIRALSEVPAPIRLAIVGEGPSQPDLVRLAADLGVSDRVDFQGWLPPEAVIGHLDSSIALLVPSLWPEPFGLVALEAFSRRCAVIASDTGGLSDLVRNGISGFLVPPGDASKMARSMLDILGKPDLRASLVETASRDLVDRFGLQLHLDRLETVYKSSVSSREVRGGKERTP